VQGSTEGVLRQERIAVVLTRHPADRLQERLDTVVQLLDLALEVGDPAAGRLSPGVSLEDGHGTVTGARDAFLED